MEFLTCNLLKEDVHLIGFMFYKIHMVMKKYDATMSLKDEMYVMCENNCISVIYVFILTIFGGFTPDCT